MDLRAASEEAAFGGVDSPLTDMRTERLERGEGREAGQGGPGARERGARPP